MEVSPDQTTSPIFNFFCQATTSLRKMTGRHSSQLWLLRKFLRQREITLDLQVEWENGHGHPIGFFHFKDFLWRVGPGMTIPIFYKEFLGTTLFVPYLEIHPRMSRSLSPAIIMFQWKMGPSNERKRNDPIEDTPIFHWTMIMGGSVSG